jgi:hypothetical protein
MKCFECDGEYEEVVINYELNTQYGKLIVPNLIVESCNKCEDDIIGNDSLVRIDEAWEKLKKEALL